MQGFAVLHPMGWDAFGLPAENAAIKAKVHPRELDPQNIDHMREQFAAARALATTGRARSPPASRSTTVDEQRIFIEMWKRGLAYRKAALVNWCHTCLTVLANEQVEDGLCWRCGSPVQQRELEQWFLEVTAYADELLAELEQLRASGPTRSCACRRTGSAAPRARSSSSRGRRRARRAIEVFTTRPDTLYGVTFMSLAAEHPLVRSSPPSAEAEVAAFAERVRAARTRSSARAEDYEKEGVDTGARCAHPLTGDELPICVANFVLMDYGTGAVMAVPAHDQRDFEFATQVRAAEERRDPARRARRSTQRR